MHFWLFFGALLLTRAWFSSDKTHALLMACDEKCKKLTNFRSNVAQLSL